MTQRTRNVLCCLGLVVAALGGPLAGIAHADHDDWRHHGWHEGYYHRPDVYYSAPPAVYPPYGYYAQPGVTLGLTLPIR
jgi:hypothetical protein